ncbi:transporter substrate-binding domain-containing protein [Variovorax sp. J22R24]|uniref:transporter substrate-binding domain-containing protein n=1 Tax=Variovorax gracilis TaxID=3053502 RepID=UPI002578D9AE|nr:transporter substrate-binding domain-containing protein [Variovorax sp. J22R24]MDM0108124.1 transporter substrate-binding domain-containing protein [Variovorax sp. J22R24]
MAGLTLMAVCGSGLAAATASTTGGTRPLAALRRLNVASKPWTGDFDGILACRLIRFDVPLSRSLYFVDKGRERVLPAELVREFERWVNKTYTRQLGKRPLPVCIIPTTGDMLLSNLAAGLGDIALGNPSVTDERRQLVDFVAPDPNWTNVEILVTGSTGPTIGSLDDLSGQDVHVRESSSYHASLVALNERIRAAGKASATLLPVPDALEDEDMLEIANAGLIGAMVVESWKARMWAQPLSRLDVPRDIVLREATPAGWAIRKKRRDHPVDDLSGPTCVGP